MRANSGESLPSIRVGQVSCLGAGLTYGWEYGDPYRLLMDAGFDCTDVGDTSGGRTMRARLRMARAERAAIERQGLGIICYHSVFLTPWAAVARNVSAQESHLECAREKGARLFLVHCLWEDFHCFPLRSKRARARQLAFDVRTLTAVGERARQYGLRLVVENNPGFPADYYLEVIARLPAGTCGAILDTGHANIQPSEAAMPLREVILRLGRRLEHLHLNDNDGIADQHLPVLCPQGSLNWREIFRALKTIGYGGVLNEELPPMTGIAWTVWSLFGRKAEALRRIWRQAGRPLAPITAVGN